MQRKVLLRGRPTNYFQLLHFEAAVSQGTEADSETEACAAAVLPNIWFRFSNAKFCTCFRSVSLLDSVFFLWHHCFRGAVLRVRYKDKRGVKIRHLAIAERQIVESFCFCYFHSSLPDRNIHRPESPKNYQRFGELLLSICRILNIWYRLYFSCYLFENCDWEKFGLSCTSLPTNNIFRSYRI